MGRIRRTKRPADPVERKLAWVRRVLWWEAAWPRAWPAAALVAAFAALAVLGFVPLAPAWLHDAILGLFALALAGSLVRLRRIPRPSPDAARRRLEDDSGLAHRPLKTLADRQTLGTGDAVARALWAAERTRLETLTRRLSVGWPRRLPSRGDPLGLRFVAAALLVVALGGVGGETGPRLLRALTPDLPAWGAPSATVEAWITPPAYTRLAPIHLSGAAPAGPLDVPQGSTLLVEVQGGRSDARLAIGRASHDFTRLGPASQRAEATLFASARIAVRQGWRTLARWPVAVVADQPPTVAFWGAPEGDRDGRLRLLVEAHDDYGVARAWAVIRRPDTSESFSVDLPLDQTRPADIRQEVRLDLTGHPWAGLPVTIALGAADDVGHQALSAPLPSTLPMRHFTHPVARAIAEMRRVLLSAPGQRRDVAVGLRALAANPDAFGGDFSVLLALTVAGARLIDDPSAAATDEVVGLLWQAAVKIEDGNRPEARQALERTIADLRRALAEGASGADIERLTAQLQQALRHYLEALAQQAARQGTTPVPPDARVVSPEDLAAMVERLHDLAATGSKDAAERMLSELGNLLNGIEQGLQSPASDRARAAMKTLDDLSGVARDQRGLLDETFRRNQMANPPGLTPPALGLLSPRARDNQRRAGPGDRATAQRQDAVRKRLGRLMESLDAQGIDVPAALGQAEEAMGDATRALARGALDDAQDAQNEAVERLDQGAREASRAVAERMGGGLGGASGAAGRDPLGRPGVGPTDGDEVAIPKQGEVKKAREVLDELRRRASDGARPPAEHDYLQRLLKSLF